MTLGGRAPLVGPELPVSPARRRPCEGGRRAVYSRPGAFPRGDRGPAPGPPSAAKIRPYPSHPRWRQPPPPL